MVLLTSGSRDRLCPFKKWSCICIIVPLLISGLAAGKSAAKSFKASQVKAAFIYNLGNFVKWPEVQWSDDSDAFVILVFGNDDIANNLEILTRGERIQGHPVIIRRASSVNDLGACNIVFVGASKINEWPQIKEACNGKSILTVGDSEAFIKEGGMINLARRERRIHLEINIDAATRANLRLNSRLLKIARIVSPEQ